MKSFLMSVLPLSLLMTFLSISVASAHEIYVLNPAEVDFALQMPRPDLMSMITTHAMQFLFWGVLSLIVLACVSALALIKSFRARLAPFLIQLKRIAPALAQLTLGFSLFASGYHRMIFGSELPLGAIFGTHALAVQATLFVLGTMLIIGVLPRLASIGATALFVALCVHYGFYMTNYATYLGEALTVALFGAGYTVHRTDLISHLTSRIIHPELHEVKFLIMRMCFGLSLVYASLYAKFFHMGLALTTVAKYNLTAYFHFDPVFLVLGAMIVEVVIGLCFIIGFEVRFASLFFLVFLTLSLLFFGEAIWPHLILIGTALAMFCHGYDRYALMPHLWQKRETSDLEPVL